MRAFLVGFDKILFIHMEHMYLTYMQKPRAALGRRLRDGHTDMNYIASENIFTPYTDVSGTLCHTL